MQGPYWEHVREAWNHRSDENFMFLFYEDLKHDLENNLKKIAQFLNKPLKHEDLPKLIHHLQFENVQKNPTLNVSLLMPSQEWQFIRRGEVGGNPEVTDEISRLFNAKTAQEFDGIGLRFPC